MPGLVDPQLDLEHLDGAGGLVQLARAVDGEPQDLACVVADLVAHLGRRDTVGVRQGVVEEDAVRLIGQNAYEKSRNQPTRRRWLRRSPPAGMRPSTGCSSRRTSRPDGRHFAKRARRHPPSGPQPAGSARGPGVRWRSRRYSRVRSRRGPGVSDHHPGLPRCARRGSDVAPQDLQSALTPAGRSWTRNWCP